MNAGVRAAVQAGVDSIEHAYFASDEVLKLMVEKGAYLVPTDSGTPTAFYTERLQHARQLGVKIAFGSDARGTVQTDAKNEQTFGERSLATLVGYQKSGMPPIDIIRTATLNAADLLGWDDPPGSLAPTEQKWVVDADKDWRNRLGRVEPGRFADLIAVTGDPLQNISELTHVQFVMKNGKVVKNSISRLP
jgi:imidazolonepropionase-like amidohydrolase